jgi:hypothetical protein
MAFPIEIWINMPRTRASFASRCLYTNILHAQRREQRLPARPPHRGLALLDSSAKRHTNWNRHDRHRDAPHSSREPSHVPSSHSTRAPAPAPPEGTSATSAPRPRPARAGRRPRPGGTPPRPCRRRPRRGSRPPHAGSGCPWAAGTTPARRTGP